MRIAIVAALAATASVAPVASAQGVPVALSEWKITLPKDTVKAGPVTFRVRNDGVMAHALYVRGEGVDKGTRNVAKGESATLTVTLKPGTYDLFCPMSEETHKMAGMALKLVVLPAAAAPPAQKKPGE